MGAYVGWLRIAAYAVAGMCLLLFACGGTHVIHHQGDQPSEGSGDVEVDRFQTVRIPIDYLGDLYPPTTAPNRRRISSDYPCVRSAAWSQKRACGNEIPHERMLSYMQQQAQYATEYVGRITNAAQESMPSDELDDAVGAGGSGEESLVLREPHFVFLIHGFASEAESARAGYDAARNAAVAGFPPNQARPVFVEIHWDGRIEDGGSFALGQWGDAQFTAPLVGLKLRRILNGLRRAHPNALISMVTHSSGGIVVASLLGDATQALPLAQESREDRENSGDAVANGSGCSWRSGQYCTDYDVYTTFAARMGPASPQPTDDGWALATADLAVPVGTNVEAFMLVAATPSTSFERVRHQPALEGHGGPPWTGVLADGVCLAFGVNPLDNVINKFMGAQNILGATGLGGNEDLVQRVRASLRDTSVRVVMERLSTSPSVANPGDHAFVNYLSQQGVTARIQAMVSRGSRDVAENPGACHDYDQASELLVEEVNLRSEFEGTLTQYRAYSGPWTGCRDCNIMLQLQAPTAPGAQAVPRLLRLRPLAPHGSRAPLDVPFVATRDGNHEARWSWGAALGDDDSRRVLYSVEIVSGNEGEPQSVVSIPADAISMYDRARFYGKEP